MTTPILSGAPLIEELHAIVGAAASAFACSTSNIVVP